MKQLDDIPSDVDPLTLDWATPDQAETNTLVGDMVQPSTGGFNGLDAMSIPKDVDPLTLDWGSEGYRGEEDSLLENMRTGAKRVPDRFKAQAGGALMSQGISAARSNEDPNAFSSQFGKAMIEKGMGLSEEAHRNLAAQPIRAKDGSLGYYAAHGVEMLFGNILPMAVAGRTMGVGAGLGVMTGQVYGEQFQQSIREGRTIDEASVDAAFTSLAETLSEKIPLGMALAQGVGFWKKTLGTGAAEATTEVLNQLAQEMYKAGYVKKDTTLPEFMLALASDEAVRGYRDSFVLGGGTGVVLGGGMYSFTKGDGTEAVPEEGGEDVPPLEGTVEAGGQMTLPLGEEGGKLPDPVAEPEAVQEPGDGGQLPLPLEPDPFAEPIELPEPIDIGPDPTPPVVEPIPEPEPEPLPDPGELPTAPVDPEPAPPIETAPEPEPTITPVPEPLPLPEVDEVSEEEFIEARLLEIEGRAEELSDEPPIGPQPGILDSSQRPRVGPVDFRGTIGAAPANNIDLTKILMKTDSAKLAEELDEEIGMVLNAFQNANMDPTLKSEIQRAMGVVDLIRMNGDPVETGFAIKEEAEKNKFLSQIIYPKMGASVNHAISKARGGSVVTSGFQNLKAEEQFAVPFMEKLLRSWMKRFAPDEKIILIDPETYGRNEAQGISSNTRGAMGGDPYRIGYSKKSGHGRTVIIMNLSNLMKYGAKKGRESIYDTLAHEFGHMLELKYFRSASPEMQSALIQDYRKWLKQMLDDMKTGLPLIEYYERRDTPRDMLGHSYSSLMSPTSNQNRDYFLSFSEYLAQVHHS